MKLQISGEDLVRVRKRRPPHKSGKLRKPIGPRSKFREVINDSEEIPMNKTIAELSIGTLMKYVDSANRQKNDAASRIVASDPMKGRPFDKKTYNKRLAGTEKAFHSMTRKLNKKLLAKEETELNELSKKTLASYVKKAMRDKDELKGLATDYTIDANYHIGNSNKRERFLKRAKDYSNKAKKRAKGIDLAADKLAKEETETPEKKSLQEMIYKKEPISKDLVSKIMEKITPEVIESLGPTKPPKGDQQTSSLGPKKPKKDTSLRSKIQKNFAETN
jgi:hypothetical protein